MKKTLSLILAVMMLLGCMSITAFAADNEATISAEITAADFGYTMVIPTSTTLTEAKHENVLLGTTAAADGDGIVSISDIKHPTDKVNVYYTVDLTKGNLTDGTTTIEAAYKYKQGDDQFAAIDGETKVTVYENATVKNSLVNVTADDTQWKAAPVGTYNATLVFNFAQKDAEEKMTIADLVGNNSYKYVVEENIFAYHVSIENDEFYVYSEDIEHEPGRLNKKEKAPANAVLTKLDNGNYSYVGNSVVGGYNNTLSLTFTMEGKKCVSISVQATVNDPPQNVFTPFVATLVAK